MPQKLKVEIAFNLAIPLLCIFPKMLKTLYYHDTCIPMFLSAQFMIVKPWKEPICSTDECITKTCYLYTMKHYSVIKMINLRHFQESVCALR